MPEQKPFIPFGINPHTPKNNPVNETTLGYVTDPILYWIGYNDEKNSNKRISYKYIPTRTYENKKLKGITYAWVKMTDAEKTEFEGKLTHPQDYYIVLIDKPGKQKLYPFYPGDPPKNFKETTTAPISGYDVGAVIKQAIKPGSSADYSTLNLSIHGGTRRRNHKKRKTRKH